MIQNIIFQNVNCVVFRLGLLVSFWFFEILCSEHERTFSISIVEFSNVQISVRTWGKINSSVQPAFSLPPQTRKLMYMWKEGLKINIAKK